MEPQQCVKKRQAWIQKISDKIDELLESITGGDRDIVSFVSEKNTNVNAVQFVIQSRRLRYRK